MWHSCRHQTPSSGAEPLSEPGRPAAAAGLLQEEFRKQAGWDSTDSPISSPSDLGLGLGDGSLGSSRGEPGSADLEGTYNGWTWFERPPGLHRLEFSAQLQASEGEN